MATPIPDDKEPSGSATTVTMAENREPKMETDQFPSLWLRAEQEMTSGNDKEKKKLIEAYLRILHEELGPSAAPFAHPGSPARQEQMRHLLESQVNKLGDKRWKLHIGLREVAVSDLFTTVLSSLITAKDAISALSNGDPNVTLACAGASVILTVSKGHQCPGVSRLTIG